MAPALQGLSLLVAGAAYGGRHRRAGGDPGRRAANATCRSIRAVSALIH
jgi:hypothetical protein